MASWDLLDDKSENDIHKTRLLNVEEKPFKRITKRLGTISALISKASEPLSSTQEGDKSSSDQARLKEDLTLDFAAFDGTITRLQFLHDANLRERERYQEDQERILGECQAVRANSDLLKEQLEVARATLAQRKKFDELAEKITSNRLLKPREEQVTNLAKLEEECRELERESGTYNETWTERRDQFNRIMDEGMLLRRQIRDEKEEVDRREGMNEGGEEEEAVDRPAQTPRHEPAGDATPHPDGENSKGDGTPRLRASQGKASTRNTPDPDSLAAHGGSPLATPLGSRPGSRDGTPLPPLDDQKKEEDDVDMEDSRQSGKFTEERGDTPSVQVEAPSVDDSMEIDN